MLLLKFQNWGGGESWSSKWNLKVVSGPIPRENLATVGQKVLDGAKRLCRNPACWFLCACSVEDRIATAGTGEGPR